MMDLPLVVERLPNAITSGKSNGWRGRPELASLRLKRDNRIKPCGTDRRVNAEQHADNG